MKRAKKSTAPTAPLLPIGTPVTFVHSVLYTGFTGEVVGHVVEGKNRVRVNGRLVGFHTDTPSEELAVDYRKALGL